MKFRRLIIFVSIFSLVALIGNIMEFGGRKNRISLNYPAIVCPDVGSGTTMQASLSDKKKLIRKISGNRVNFKAAGVNRVLSNSGSILIDGEGVNSSAWISKSGIWAGGVICLSPKAKQYFVGGSADVSSKSNLILVNSGLSTSIVDIRVFSDGSSFIKSFTVKKNQSKSVSLVSLAPGSKSVAFMVTPKTGRVSAYLFDERSKGLQTLGGDLVNSQSELNKTLYIPAIPHKSSIDKSHILRILNPNSINTNISVEIISKDGRYVPVSLDNRKVSADRTMDFLFDFDSKRSAFAIKISSDQPIAAAVYSRFQAKGKTDFVWSTPVATAITGKWAITGLDPLLVATGNEINMTLTVTKSNGKKVSIQISGSDMATYQIPTGAIAISIDSIAKDNSAALLVNSQSGTGYIPLINGSELTRSTVPTANIGVLNP